jgi:hypothetical protein
MARPLHALAPLLVCLLVALPAVAQDVPETLTHQGRLVHENGQPMTGTVELIYTLYTASTAGDILWQQTVEADLDDDGFFAVEIGGGTTPILPLLRTEEPRWLGVIVDQGSEMRPRLKLTSVPYALFAQEAVQARSVADGSIHTEALATDFEIDPQIALGGLSCAANHIARYNGTNWVCDSLNPLNVGSLVADGRVTAESFHASSEFFEDAVLSSYPLGVSWQTGRGTAAPTTSSCRYGIVQTLYLATCRARQICYEQNGSILSRYLASHCEASGPWGPWVQVGP